jgi:hypothetical protein
MVLSLPFQLVFPGQGTNGRVHCQLDQTFVTVKKAVNTTAKVEKVFNEKVSIVFELAEFTSGRYFW